MNPITVSQVNNYIANKLRSDFNLKDMAVEGEISGLSQGAGHIYFTLKDKDSMIRCAIWKSIRKNIDESLLENGRQVVVIADISPYAKGGSYSLDFICGNQGGLVLPARVFIRFGDDIHLQIFIGTFAIPIDIQVQTFVSVA